MVRNTYAVAGFSLSILNCSYFIQGHGAPFAGESVETQNFRNVVIKLEDINVSKMSHMLDCFITFRIKKVCRLYHYPSCYMMVEAIYRLQMLRKWGLSPEQKRSPVHFIANGPVAG